MPYVVVRYLGTVTQMLDQEISVSLFRMKKRKRKGLSQAARQVLHLPSRRFRWQKPSKKIIEAGWGAARIFWFDKTDSDSNDTCQASN